MIYREDKESVFTAGKDYCLAHCIASDAICGKGIAPQFVLLYPGMKKELQWLHPAVGQAVLWTAYGKSPVFNLISKERTSGKPSYNTLTLTLIDMRNQMIRHGYTKLAIPLIGCGLDGLRWDVVKQYIKQIFEDTWIEVVVYFYDDWTIPLMEKNQEKG